VQRQQGDALDRETLGDPSLDPIVDPTGGGVLAPVDSLATLGRPVGGRHFRSPLRAAISRSISSISVPFGASGAPSLLRIPLAYLAMTPAARGRVSRIERSVGTGTSR
jgi:hypothetical protein